MDRREFLRAVIVGGVAAATGIRPAGAGDQQGPSGEHGPTGDAGCVGACGPCGDDWQLGFVKIMGFAGAWLVDEMRPAFNLAQRRMYCVVYAWAEVVKDADGRWHPTGRESAFYTLSRNMAQGKHSSQGMYHAYRSLHDAGTFEPLGHRDIIVGAVAAASWDQVDDRPYPYSYLPCGVIVPLFRSSRPPFLYTLYNGRVVSLTTHE